jgi:hypothetical protein
MRAASPTASWSGSIKRKPQRTNELAAALRFPFDIVLR